MVLRTANKNLILITGASGMLGTDLVDELSGFWGQKNIIATDNQDLDITDLKQIESFLRNNPITHIINAAAYTDVDRAEIEREKAYLINSVGPRNLAQLANPLGIPIIHFSTDYVFDGSGTLPLTEEDIPNPPKPNYYGETKLLGEQSVLKNPINLVLRIQWLYGKKKERFSSLRNKATFTPFEDQWGAPTWTRDVSRAIIQLIQKEARGLFHFAYDDFASWYEVYTFVKKELDLKTQLIPLKTAEVSLPAKRPRFGVMSNKKLLSKLEIKSMGSWKNSLKEFLSQL